MNSPLRKDRLISLAARVEEVLAFNERVLAFKTRNAMGEFAPNDGGVVDESMMAKAYGAPSAVRRNLVGGGGKAGLAVASGGKATAARLVGRSGTRLPVIRRAASRLLA